MPYKSGFIQAAIGALCSVAFLISQQFGSPEPKLKKLVGTFEKTGDQSFVLTEANERQHRFELTTPHSVFLNERQISFSQIDNGRKVTVQYSKKKGHMFAAVLDVFPVYSDFEPTGGMT